MNKEYLEFDNLNFKLAIIQTLMYDLEILEPAFNVFDYAEKNPDANIDIASDEPIEEVLDFFRNLQVPMEYAEKVENIDMDGGNDIYMNIAPQWDGEDEIFDLNQVSVRELQQFPNLKRAILMTSNFEEVKKMFEQEGIETELL